MCFLHLLLKKIYIEKEKINKKRGKRKKKDKKKKRKRKKKEKKEKKQSLVVKTQVTGTI
jgi:hypothetical protein